MIGCGPHPAVTIAFFLSYVMMSSFILINIFVAILVDSVSTHFKVRLSSPVVFICDGVLIVGAYSHAFCVYICKSRFVLTVKVRVSCTSVYCILVSAAEPFPRGVLILFK